MKQKTHSGVKKRIKLTGRKKIVYKKPCRNHLLIHKSKGQKRGFRKGVVANLVNEHEMKAMLKI